MAASNFGHAANEALQASQLLNKQGYTQLGRMFLESGRKLNIAKSAARRPTTDTAKKQFEQAYRLVSAMPEHLRRTSELEATLAPGTAASRIRELAARGPDALSREEWRELSHLALLSDDALPLPLERSTYDALRSLAEPLSVGYTQPATQWLHRVNIHRQFREEITSPADATRMLRNVLDTPVGDAPDPDLQLRLLHALPSELRPDDWRVGQLRAIVDDDPTEIAAAQAEHLLPTITSRFQAQDLAMELLSKPRPSRQDWFTLAGLKALPSHLQPPILEGQKIAGLARAWKRGFSEPTHPTTRQPLSVMAMIDGWVDGNVLLRQTADLLKTPKPIRPQSTLHAALTASENHLAEYLPLSSHEKALADDARALAHELLHASGYDDRTKMGELRANLILLAHLSDARSAAAPKPIPT